MTGAHGATPDFCYDPNEWAETCEWSDRDQLTEELRIGAVMEVCTLIFGPTKWAARVVTESGDDGEVEDTEVQWFDTEAEAQASSAPFPDGDRDDR